MKKTTTKKTTTEKVIQSTVELYDALATRTKGKAKYGLVTN